MLLRLISIVSSVILAIFAFALISGGALMLSIKSYAPLVTGYRRPLMLAIGCGFALLSWAVIKRR